MQPMNRNEVYMRVRRMLIIILVMMVIVSFVGVMTLNQKVEELMQAQNILIEYIGRGGRLDE